MPLPVNLYESPALRTITGPAIRPGGMTLTERAVAFCKLPEGSIVLDVGCGSGATVAHLRKKYILCAYGLDLSRELLADCLDPKANPALIHGRAESLPIADARIDAIFCECALSLIPSPETALAEWHRALAPDGYLIVSDLYARSVEMQERKNHSPVRCCLDGAVDREALFTRMAAAGFNLLLFEDHTLLLKQLAARLVWEYGSLDAFWSTVGGSCNAGMQASGGRPGYYLMVARKGVSTHE